MAQASSRLRKDPWQDPVLPPGTRFVRIRQVRSTIGVPNRRSTEDTLKGLSLFGIGREAVVVVNGPNLGQLRKVRHLVIILGDESHSVPKGTRAALTRVKIPRMTREERDVNLDRPGSTVGGDFAPDLLFNRLTVDYAKHLGSGNVVEAMRLASIALGAAKRSTELPLKSADRRRELQPLVRDLYRTMFSEDPAAAAQAAYGLVANSRELGTGLDPRRPLKDLTQEENRLFRQGLDALLSRSNVNFLTAADAQITGEREDKSLVRVAVTVSRWLPFKVDGKSVPLPGKPPTDMTKDNVIIGCPWADETVDFELHAFGSGAMKAEATFVIPSEMVAGKALPVIVFVPGGMETLKIPM